LSGLRFEPGTSGMQGTSVTDWVDFLQFGTEHCGSVSFPFPQLPGQQTSVPNCSCCFCVPITKPKYATDSICKIGTSFYINAADRPQRLRLRLTEAKFLWLKL